MQHAIGGQHDPAEAGPGDWGHHRDPNGSRSEQGCFIAGDRPGNAPRMW